MLHLCHAHSSVAFHSSTDHQSIPWLKNVQRHALPRHHLAHHKQGKRQGVVCPSCCRRHVPLGLLLLLSSPFCILLWERLLKDSDQNPSDRQIAAHMKHRAAHGTGCLVVICAAEADFTERVPTRRGAWLVQKLQAQLALAIIHTGGDVARHSRTLAAATGDALQAAAIRSRCRRSSCPLPICIITVCLENLAHILQAVLQCCVGGIQLQAL
mmetsp:Transcript_7296/g.12566  ORF Transcript_7296/g.12566 Transcript_7296/m.12566 type:complete len:212 (-) Transcript_7296:495-1130(-)